jgi:hypothetical protein
MRQNVAHFLRNFEDNAANTIEPVKGQYSTIGQNYWRRGQSYRGR